MSTPGRPVAPGRFVEIGGTPMHAVVDGRGEPVVVLESGLGGGVVEWAAVAEALAGRCTVVRRDRPGLGWSPESRRERSAVAAAADLHELLHRLELAPPYVLVGHSLGGFHARAFAGAHPDEVAGVVFVDASHEDVFTAGRGGAWYTAVGLTVYRAAAGVAGVVGAGALARLYERIARGSLTEPLSPAAEEAIATTGLLLGRDGAWLRAMRDEFGAINRSCHDVRRLRRDVPFPAVPVRVITQGRPERGRAARRLGEQLRTRHHPDLATLSQQGRHVIAGRSGHIVPLDQPEIIVEQVLDVLDVLAGRGAGGG